MELKLVSAPAHHAILLLVIHLEQLAQFEGVVIVVAKFG